MKTSNEGIIARSPPSNKELRDKMYALPLGGILRTKDPHAKILAGSLSRTSKKKSGTWFSVRDIGVEGYGAVNEIEIQRVRYYP